MAQVKRIRWTLLALQDLDHAYHYIAKERPSAAHQIIQQLQRALDALIQYPLMGRTGRLPGTRELYIAHTPFVLAYRLHSDQIEILGFMHAARRWPESL